ncbi:type I polyketide synthase [Xanthomonas hortorum]|uniref:SDR family NAD(P)-dependent oxidoreductase n=6 Tax=Xanthomonas hortorum TaxID=56454 RepID=A0A6V7D9G5_9XANT|nr:type I polyketide synthase [Xanthomonas hortorum]MCE4354750.1 SDR family NAD(P)-dependent oxidoreductase [Xanthomonas hortorum pv. pelargonii]MCM5522882.1 SDR family NAD(P)-dependent oxidoreductase [Xanthomonas hortorum pv. pelargonii]MCM5535068.1 SDR family NAD(P)-dependent oxidoreductase [Xanthomonas hortorum pv. pelargonii]MCM5539043.1 SDR family NAD(P)-dependent oxidoreductase [Xanthomonas hortorum pv. pelargonii]MCM5543462.1 SDR family NAD(P)-dependent oxidoreductase [Xanthomonas horto
MDDASPRNAQPDFRALVTQHYPGCDPVAVIGHAGRFADAPDNEALWHNLVNGQACSHHFSRQQLLDAGLPASTVDAPNFVGVGSVVADADAFDADLFGYSRQEAESIDPQQRLFLQIAWHALEHAGYAPRQVPHKTGVFGSARVSTYPGKEPLRIAEVAQVKRLQSLMGNDKDYVATRAAYKLNLHGPAISVQTACSSSLVAVHMACESLRAGECDMAVAGGVAVSFPQHSGYLHQPGMIFSPDGLCRPFDAQAQGTFGGNGAGAVVLRRLADALRDGDPIVAVVLGSAVNNDGGRKVGYTAPSVAGQSEVIREAMTLAGVESRQIGLIEAHGTATPLGDPIEVEALRAVFHGRDDGPACALGSVKSNLGHLDTAAGIASLLKAVLAVERAIIPPCLHFRSPNPALRLEDSPFHVPTQAEPWRAPIRCAGVSSFGIGGTNCHLIVACLPEALRAAASATGPDADANAVPTGTLLLSAASEAALRRLAGAYAQALGSAQPADLAHTALHGRQLQLGFRLATPLSEETAAALAACAAGEDDVLLQRGDGEPGKQAWLFTGQGSHWPGMGQALYRHSPAFADRLEHCLAACESSDQPLTPSLREALLGQHGELLERTDYAQPAIVAFELAMAAHWQSLGLQPDLVLGHSVGEFAAAVVAGHYPADAVMRLVCLRGALMQRCSGGGMLSAFADHATLLPLAAPLGLELAACNGDRHLVFSGEREAIDAFAAALDAREIRCNRLSVAGAAHSRQLDPILADFQRAAASLRAAPGRLPLISTLTGEIIDAQGLDAPDYWRRHLREPVRFIQALRTALAQGADIFLELGPDAPLTGIGSRELADTATWIASARRHQPAPAQLQHALLQLYAAGAELPWHTLLPSAGRKIHAPLYSFDTERYWRESEPTPVSGPTAQASWVGSGAPEAGRHIALQAATQLDLPRLHALYACVTKLHAIDVDALVRRCVGARIEPGVSVLEVLRGGRLLPRHRQLLTRLLDACVEDGYYRRDNHRYSAAAALPQEPRAALIETLRACCEGLDVIADTVARAGEQLYAMMSGQVEPVAVIFPEGASAGVEVLYQDFSFGRYFNQIAAGTLAGLMQERQAQRRQHQPYRILEVGGGTGGTTAWLLPELADQPALHYDFTDISALFTRRAERKFAQYGFVAYRELDLQQDAQAQGFEAAGYDLIVAANVIHATQHVGRTLANLYPLLKPGGRLLLREITRPMRLFDFVFGPLVAPLHDAAARGGELFLSTARWKQHCLAAGFERVDWLPEDGTPTAAISEHILLATAPGQATDLVLPWQTGAGDGILGHALTDDGCYLADWSDCAGQDARWQERVHAACAELARRHGSGQALVPAGTPAVPTRLALVRLRWQAAPFAAPQVGIEACDAQDGWRFTLAACAAAPGLPAPLPAPATHYAWQWSAAADAAATPQPFALRDATAETVAALHAAGVRLAPQAPQALLLLDSGDEDPLSVVTPLLAALSGDQPLLVVTRCAWKIGADARVDPVQHAAWGLLRVAAAEHPTRALAVVDLDAQTGWDDLLPALAAVAAGQRWIAVRGKRVLLPQLVAQPHAAPALPPAGLADARWHVVTGAFGGLGRLSVQWLARHGARRIALLAPRAPTDWADFQLMLSERDGCRLHWLPCDVGDPEQLTQALETLQADGGIAGVIHSAGLLHDAPLASLDRTLMAPVLAVKAQAARRLHAWLQAHHGRYLLLYSSAAAALGAAGQGAHALASAYLDGLALAQDPNTLPKVISIGWGAWGDTGRAVDPALQNQLATSGMGLLASTEGLWHLDQAVMRAAPYRLAMRVLSERLDPQRRALLAPVVGTAPPVRSASNAKAARAGNATPDQATLSPAPTDLHDAAAVSAWLSERIAAQLRLDDPSRLSPGRDLLQLGLDSLLFLELSSDIQRQLGVRLDAEHAYRDLSVTGLTTLIAALAGDPASITPTGQVPAALEHDAPGRYQPFPLTAIQHAYWLGRTDLIDYGGVACHVLFEWDLRHDAFDLARLERAWNTLVQRHDMLRMVVDADGQQRILAQVPVYRIERHDLRALSAPQRQQALEDTRQALSYRVPPTDRWPMFELLASDLDGRHYRLHMNLDLLMFDVQSFKVMLDDLASAYRSEDLPPLPITFRDYVLAEQARRQEDSWQASWQYWQGVLADLPPAPRLPLAAKPALTQPRFTTYQTRLDASAWAALKQEWQRWGVTPSAALLTLFAHTLERWSRQPDFTLNLTFFDRLPIHPQIRALIGDFTSVLLVDFDLSRPVSLRASIEHTQQRLWKRLAHSQVNGVELLRELGKGRGHQRQPLMPVVFTSMLGMSLDGLAIDQALTGLLGDPVHVFTQTPQVWLDHQVMEIDGELVCSWYCMDEVLEHGAAQAMFEDYRAVLGAVAAQPEVMQQAGVMQLLDGGGMAAFARAPWPALVHDAGIDLRDLEDALRERSDIVQAEAVSASKGDALDVQLVAAERDCLPPEQVPCDPGPLAPLDTAQQHELDCAWSWLEMRAVRGIAATLLGHGLFERQGQRHRLDEVHARLRALPQYRRLLRQWLHLLCTRGWLRQDGDAFVCERAFTDDPGPAQAPPDAPWCCSIAGYLDSCIDQHAALLTGTRSPLELLFADSAATTHALYIDNPASRCLNGHAAQVARALSEGRSDLRVLEVGAGIGSTTRQLLPALEGRLALYRFTDVSTLFLDDARTLFADTSHVDYALLDINRPVDFDQHPAQGYDLIFAGQVMHDASHVVRTLRRLGMLLKPGGRLMLTEATERDSALQMASVGFIEGLVGYQDARIVDDKPMLDLPMWRSALEQAGFGIELAWPEQTPSPLRQHLIVARAERIGRLDLDAIADEMRARFGTRLPALQLRQCERLGRGTDTAPAIPSAAPSTAADTPLRASAPDDGAADQDALERQLAEIWQELLARPIQRDSDFFQSGGDSLIATRMIARLHRQGLRGATLQGLFANPVLAAFCSLLASPREADSAPAPIALARGSQAGRAFVLHASDGELGAYLPLANALDTEVFGLQAPEVVTAGSLNALAAGYAAAIGRMQPQGRSTLIGWSYGAFVAAETARQLHQAGAKVELVLIDPVCRADFAFSNRATLLRLIANGRLQVPLPDDLEQLDPDAQLACFARNAEAAGVLAAPRDPALARAWIERIARLLEMLARHLAPDLLPVPCLWLSATRRPAHWTPAEHDWSLWAPHAERHTLEADHWQLLMDDGSARRVAGLIRQWQQRPHCIAEHTA